MSKKEKRTFRDTRGRKYTVRITIPLLRAIRDELDVDLGTPDGFFGLSSNALDVVNVLYLCVQDQASKYKLDDVGFGEALDGDTVAEAWQAFNEAYIDFCPGPQRKVLRRLMDTATELTQQKNESSLTKLDSLLESLKSPPATAENSGYDRTTTVCEN